MGEEILEGTGEPAGFRIGLTEGHEVFDIANPDRIVGLEPGAFFRRDGSRRPGVRNARFGQALVEIGVFLMNGGQGPVQLGQNVRTAFRYGVVIIRGADPAGGEDSFVGVHRIDVGEAIQGSPDEHVVGFVLFRGEGNNLNGQAVLVGPVLQKACLDAAFVNADAFSVEGGKIIRTKLVISGVNINIVGFRTHGQIRIGEKLLPLRLVGYVSEKIDLALFQLFEQIRPAVLHVFKGPAGVSGNLLLILIVDAAAAAELIPIAEGRIKPADADYLRRVFSGRGGERQDGGQRQRQQQEDGGGFFQGTFHSHFGFPPNRSACSVGCGFSIS